MNPVELYKADSTYAVFGQFIEFSNGSIDIEGAHIVPKSDDNLPLTHNTSHNDSSCKKQRHSPPAAMRRHATDNLFPAFAEHPFN
jgi:hypothetical protein